MKLDIYQYNCALTYFTDSYKALKTNADFSLREWSEGFGFESPSLILDILKKKRPLKLKYSSLLAQGLGLDSNEMTYFKTLIFMEKAANPEEKAYFEETLNALRPEGTSINKEGGIYSSWLNVVIFTLTQMNGASMDIHEIKTSLKQDIPLSTIEDSLTILLNHKLIEKVGEKYKCCMRDFISTPNDVSIKSTHAYYSQVISQAQSAVKMGVDEREFQCFTIGMKKENLAKVKDVIRNARKEIATFSDDHGDHVYQFNLNGFPMAEVRREIQV